jgi:transposase
MTIGYHDYRTIPIETERVVKATLKQSNKYVVLRDELGVIYRDATFADLYCSHGAESLPPGLVAQLVVIQYVEQLSDRAVMEQLPVRLDWKYFLGLELTHPGFDHSVLSEFRQRLTEHAKAELLLEGVLAVCTEAGLVKARGRQRTDSTYVLAAVRSLNRPELLGESMRHALDALATLDPQWVQALAPAEWYIRYGQRIESYRLPKGQAAVQQWMLQVGHDGEQLLAALAQPTTAAALSGCEAVKTLRLVWQQQFLTENGQWRLRRQGEMPPAAEMIQSPYDPEARYSEKRQLQWEGYKVHVSETCDAQTPALITHVETTPAPVADFAVLADIQAALAAHERTPAHHLIDGGYLDAKSIVDSQNDYQIELIGPVSDNLTWQAKANQGYDQSHFTLDWEQQTATCPNAKVSRLWSEAQDTLGNTTIQIRFAAADCADCPARVLCTRSPSAPRSLRILPKEEYLALHAARQRQQTPAFRALYDLRAGIEGAFSWAVRSFGLRTSRYIGHAKTHLHAIAVAAAINLERLADFFAGHEPTPTRLTPLARLAAQLTL